MHREVRMDGSVMRHLRIISAFAAVAGAALTCFADYAVTEATSSSQTFALYTSTAATPTYSASSGALASPFNITYRDGETVSATSPAGVTTALSGTGGQISFTPSSGGVWMFTNSNGATAQVGVGWDVHGDGFAPQGSGAEIVRIETVREGPDRKVKISAPYPSLAYSGDDWKFAADAAATLTVTSPSGESTQFDLSGTGKQQFAFNKSGTWTVTLASASGTRTAIVTVTGGLVIIFQ